MTAGRQAADDPTGSAESGELEGSGATKPEWKLRIQPDPDNIPAQLRAVPQWVAWKLGAPAKVGDKPRKIPVDPFTGTAARANDPRTWGIFQAACDRWRRESLAGIGFMLSNSGFAGVDLDDCVDPDTGVIADWAKQIAEDLCSYTELSPSGTGLRIIARGSLPPGRRRSGHVEVYDEGRYLTLTGSHVGGFPITIEDRAEELADLVERLGRNGRRDEPPTFQASGEPIGDDAQLIERACKAKNGATFEALHRGEDAGYASRSEADAAYLCHLAFWTGRAADRMDRLFRASGRMRDKWTEPRGDTTWGQLEIANALARVSTAYRAIRPIPKPEKPTDDVFRCTDTANARRLVNRFGATVRYSHVWKTWMVWDGRRWKTDDEGTPMELSRLVARDVLREASECNDASVRSSLVDWAERSEKVDRRKAMIVCAQSEKGIPLRHTELDQHPMLFNAANGTIDLETGRTRPFQQSDMMTKLCPTAYEPAAKCPTWDKFLERVFPDPDTRAYVQRLAACCLTGDVSDHAIVLALGDGANGKTTFFKTLQLMFSRAYAIQIAGDLLLAKQQRGHPTELADLFGVRLAIGTETNRNQEFDEALIKQLTGGDLLRVRRMREDFWEFESTHKLVLITNHMPRFRATEAMARRIHLLRFDVTIPKTERNRHLMKALAAEHEGILAWCMRGVPDWRLNGLNPPADMQVPLEEPDAATSNAADFITRFIERRPGARLGATRAYTGFALSCKSLRAEPCSQAEFGRAMGHAGYGRAKSNGNYIYLDAAFVPPPGTVGDDSRVDAAGGTHEEADLEKVPIVPGAPRRVDGVAVSGVAHRSSDRDVPGTIATAKCETVAGQSSERAAEIGVENDDASRPGQMVPKHEWVVEAADLRVRTGADDPDGLLNDHTADDVAALFRDGEEGA